MMKKVAFICVVLVCVAVLSAGCLSTSMMSPSISAPSSSKNAVESTPPASTTLVASNPSIKALKPSALTANQLSRRQSYGGPFYSSSKSLTKRYHYPGCFEVANIDAENLIAFNTHVEACAAGYKPCLRCDPPPCGRFILKNV
jgi:Metal binding domain of Ada